MRLTAILLFAACITASARTGAQTVSLSVKEARLEQVFKEIRRQTGYNFLYNEEWMRSAKKISVSVNRASLTSVLDLCFKDQPFTYTIIQKTIALKPKMAIEIHSSIQEEMGQGPPSIDIRGRIVNEKGEPVIAGVQVKGTNKGITTNDNGEFELKGIDDNAILVISGISIETFEVKVNGRSELALNARIKSAVGENVTVEVNTGYQRIPKERVTGSFEVVSNQLFNRSVTTNVLPRLEGVVPGLIFNRRIGGANNPDNISIRGISTLQSDQRPLIVVDNFPYDGDINNINPNDVDNVSVLKDAAAASIWGAKAGNGVIVITTKRGRYDQKLRITANSNIGIVEKPDLFYFPSFPASEFIGIEKFLFGKGYYNADLSNVNMPVVSPVVEILNRRKNGLITAADSATQLNALMNNDVRKDYEKYLYQRGLNWQNSISLSGGSNIMNYLFAVGYDKNISNLVGNEQDRVTIRSQNNLRPVKNLEVQFGTVITMAGAQNNSLGAAIFADGGKGNLYPYARLADENGKALATEKLYRMAFRDTAGNGKLLPWTYKPLDELELADKQNHLTDLVLNAGAKYNFTSWLSAEVKYQLEKAYSNGRVYNSPQSFITRNRINEYTPPGGSYTSSAVPFGGILDKTTGQLTSHSGRAQINVNKSFGTIHSIDGILGTEIRQTHSVSDRAFLYGYDDHLATYKNTDLLNVYPTYFGSSGNIPGELITKDKMNRFVSFYGNASYTLKSRYALSASARRDASNLFGTSTNNKWKPLWSVGSSWKLSGEDFYKLSFLPELKLKATYGYSGNVNNANPALLTLSALGTPNQFTNLTQYNINNPPNPTLRWEKVSMFNVGIEFALTRQIVSGTIEYYEKRSTDLISRVNADITTGFPDFVVNSASLKGHGVDVNLVSKNIDRRYFKWSTNLLFSYNTNKVEKYLLNRTAKDYLTEEITPLVGENAYSLIAGRWGGLDPANGDPRGYVDGKISSDYAQIANSVNIADFVIKGSSRPLIFGAFRNTVSWKSFSVSANIMYRFKYYFRRPSAISYNTLASFWDVAGYSDYINRWQKPGDEANTNVPSFAYPINGNRDNFYKSSEAVVEKGDHIRLQDINLSYSLNKRFSFYAYISNLGVIWKATSYKIDPDYGTPLPKSYSLGVKIEL